MDLKNKNILVLCGLLLCGGLSASPGLAETTDLGPQDITMKSLNATKPAVFPHRRHQEKFVCMQCHHVDGEKLEVGKCHTCHNENMGNEKLNTMKKTGHSLCKQCHKEQRDAGVEVSGKCSTCHPLAIRKPLPSYAQ